MTDAREKKEPPMDSERELREKISKVLWPYPAPESRSIVDDFMPLIQRHCALLVAGAYEAAAKKCDEILESRDPEDARGIAAANLCAMEIESATPADAAQALAERQKEVAASARLNEHLMLCPKCTRKDGHVIGVRCVYAVALERILATPERGEGESNG